LYSVRVTSDNARARAIAAAVLELGEQCTVKSVALLAAPEISADERTRLQAAVDQLHAALRNLNSSTAVPHRRPPCAGHPAVVDPLWPDTLTQWLGVDTMSAVTAAVAVVTATPDASVGRPERDGGQRCRRRLDGAGAG
jgi:hypothetical protein